MPSQTPTDQPSPADSKSAWRAWTRQAQGQQAQSRQAQGQQAQSRQAQGQQAWSNSRQITASEPLSAQLVNALADFLTPILAKPEALVLFYRAISPPQPPPQPPQPPQVSKSAEPALEPLADRLGWDRFALTRTPESGPLTIHPASAAASHPAKSAMKSSMEMERHRFGFLQPTQDAPELVTDRIAVALVPGLLFDRHGNRLGHGAGYYDELLNRMPDNCARVGVCWSDNIVDLLPTDSHDVPMTHLATEHGVRLPEPASGAI